MKHKKCPMCSSSIEVVLQKYESSTLDKDTQEKIVVPNVRVIKCQNPECANEWLPNEEEEKIERAITKGSYHFLNPREISLIRESFPFSTKTETAQFLGLNSKAFTKWENGYTEQNPAYDLLLRLVAFDQKNFDFVNHLHTKQFKFIPNDYQLVCDKLNIDWNFAKLVSSTTSQPLANVYSAPFTNTTAVKTQDSTVWTIEEKNRQQSGEAA